MIASRKSALFTRMFAWYSERKIRAAFEALRIRGLDTLTVAVAGGPVLVVTNHTAWWDPLFAIAITNRIFSSDSYAMMDAANLRRLPFFANVGAFGVDLADAADGARAIRYAAKLLAHDKRVVWIFAQGREVPITVRPLDFRPGSGEIARVARRCSVIPAALRYEMGSTERPTAWLSFGDAIAPIRDRAEARRAHEIAVTRELDAIDQAIVTGESAAFATHYRDEGNRIFALAQRALARLTKPRTLS